MIRKQLSAQLTKFVGKNYVTDACCSTPPTNSNYKPKGEIIKKANLDFYITGANKPKTLLAAYDIFGFHENTFQFCDILSQSGFRVIMPDFFYGDYYKLSDYDNKTKLSNWVKEKGTWGQVKADIQLGIELLKEQDGTDKKVKEMGILGFCWGAFASLHAVSKSNEELGFKVACITHPSFILDIPPEKILRPVLNIASKDEPDLKPYMDKLVLVKDQSKYFRFDDMAHGFCSSRAQLEDSKVRDRFQEANQLFADFFKKYL